MGSKSIALASSSAVLGKGSCANYESIDRNVRDKIAKSKRVTEI